MLTVTVPYKTYKLKKRELPDEGIHVFSSFYCLTVLGYRNLSANMVSETKLRHVVIFILNDNSGIPIRLPTDFILRHTLFRTDENNIPLALSSKGKI